MRGRRKERRASGEKAARASLKFPKAKGAQSSCAYSFLIYSKESEFHMPPHWTIFKSSETHKGKACDKGKKPSIVFPKPKRLFQRDHSQNSTEFQKVERTLRSALRAQRRREPVSHVRRCSQKASHERERDARVRERKRERDEEDTLTFEISHFSHNFSREKKSRAAALARGARAKAPPP